MRSITIDRILDIPIRINLTLLLFLPLLAWLITGQIELYGDLVQGIGPMGGSETSDVAPPDGYA